MMVDQIKNTALESFGSLQSPWFESPFFEAELAARAPTGEQEEQVRFFRDNGYLIFPEAFPAEFADRIRAATEPLFDDSVPDGPRSRGRVQDAWDQCSVVRELACDEKVLGFLRWLYGREPRPFQTLNFRYGTQQRVHRDTFFFDTLPAGFLCAVWVALEDVSAANGSLFYFPGSHRMPRAISEEMGFGYRHPSSGRPFDENEVRFVYEGRLLPDLLEAHGYQKATLEVPRGSAVLWAAGLAHGGGEILEQGRTRWSQVTHYVFEGCLYLTPLYSNQWVGDLYLRHMTDIRSGQSIPNRYCGSNVEGVGINGTYRLFPEHRDGEEYFQAVLWEDAAAAFDERSIRLGHQLVEQTHRLEEQVARQAQLISQITGSRAFRLGRAITAPARWLRGR